MVAPVIIAAAITAAASTAQNARNQSAANSATKQGRQFAVDMYNTELTHERENYDKRYAQQRADFLSDRSTNLQNMVQDAKAAGLHPAFAMGGAQAGNFSPAISSRAPSALAPPSGSYAGSGISAAGKALAAGIRGNAAAKLAAINEARNAEMHEANMVGIRTQNARDEISLMAEGNEFKRAEMAALNNPTASGELLKPAEPEARPHGVVDLPLLGRVKMRKRGMAAGGATEQAGEVSDYLYGLDLLNRWRKQRMYNRKVFGGGMTQKGNLRNQRRKALKKRGQQHPDDWYLGGG